MARERLCKVCREWHDLSEPWPAECAAPAVEPSHLPTPLISHDTMNAVQSMTNGMYYESKSALRNEYKRAGVVEVGNDVPKEKPKVDWKAEKTKRAASIGRAISRVGLGA